MKLKNMADLERGFRVKALDDKVTNRVLSSASVLQAAREGGRRNSSSQHDRQQDGLEEAGRELHVCKS